MRNPSFTANKSSYLLAAKWTFLTYLITAIHHYYTGVLYHTMWRAEFAFQAIIPTAICLAALYLHYKGGSRGYLIIFSLVSFIFFFLVVGIWEGAWCHTTKLMFYSLGIPFHNAPAAWNIPAAPIPTDVFSEVTGVLNFVFSAINLHHMIKLLKKTTISDENVINDCK